MILKHVKKEYDKLNMNNDTTQTEQNEINTFGKNFNKKVN